VAWLPRLGQKPTNANIGADKERFRILCTQSIRARLIQVFFKETWIEAQVYVLISLREALISQPHVYLSDTCKSSLKRHTWTCPKLMPYLQGFSHANPHPFTSSAGFCAVECSTFLQCANDLTSTLKLNFQVLVHANGLDPTKHVQHKNMPRDDLLHLPAVVRRPC